MAKFLFSRRVLLASAASSLSTASLGVAPALAGPTGIEVLDTAAIPVLEPDRVLLVAITKAGSRFVAAGQHGVIIYSDDDGTSWTQSQVPVDVTLTCISFVTPLLGWAAGHFGVVLRTEDGGKSWQMQLNGIQANQLTFAAAQVISAQDSQLPAASFAQRRAEIFMQGGAKKPFLALVVPNAQTVFVFGAYRMSMASQDGGRNWVDISLYIGDKLSHNIYGAAEIGQNIYLAGEAGMVFCSTDGGKTFPAVASPSDVTLFGLVGAYDDSIIVFGVAGNGFRSADGGNSWTQIDLPTQDNLTAGHVLESGAVLLATISGLLFLSHDNGVNFTQLQNIPPISIFDFAQNVQGDALFVGGSGVIRLPAAQLT